MDLKNLEDLKYFESNIINIQEFKEIENITPEILCSKINLEELCSKAKKLKTLETMSGITTGNIIFLTSILEKIIHNGQNTSAIIGVDDLDLIESLIEPRLHAATASLIVFYIMTSKKMPKEIYFEEIINSILIFMSKHLECLIYPLFVKFQNLKNLQSKYKKIFKLYKQIIELFRLLSELFCMKVQSDSSLIYAISLALTPFFVEGLLEIQLLALPIITEIFSKYITFRRFILKEILSSISKISVNPGRAFKINKKENIQIFTALILHIIQSSYTISKELNNLSTKKDYCYDVIIINKFEHTIIILSEFLQEFINKLECKQNQIRIIFKNFFFDLLTTFHKPEWPASELMLSLLGNYLIKKTLNKSTDICVRSSTLEYFGALVAHLRKNMKININIINQIINNIVLGQLKNEEKTMFKTESEIGDIERIQYLQNTLLNYFDSFNEKREFYNQIKQFTIGLWYRELKESENNLEIKKIQQKFLLAKLLYQNQKLTNDSQNYIDYENLVSISQYLASNGSFSKNFPNYIKLITYILADPLQVLRSKALKCLTMILEVDPDILSQIDIQSKFLKTFLDESKIVREAAIDAIGKLILIKPELIEIYYPKLSARILDNGVSVRKRIIRIFKDISIKYPDHNKISEICVKLTERINDSEEIGKLVVDFFKNFLFIPFKKESCITQVNNKVQNIIKIILSEGINLELLEVIILEIFNKNSSSEHLSLSIKNLVDNFIERLITHEESIVKNKETNNCLNETFSKLFYAHMVALYLFAKVRPQFLVKHVIHLQTYLSVKCITQYDYDAIGYLIRTLELVVPLVENPSEMFTANLEEDTIKLILKYNKTVVDSCLSLISYIIHNLTRNFDLISNLFLKLYTYLLEYQKATIINPINPNIVTAIPFIKRFLYIIGNLIKYFDFKNKNFIGLPNDLNENILKLFLSFMKHPNEEIQYYTLKAIGAFCIRYNDVIHQKEVKDLYYQFLKDSNSSFQMKFQVLLNIELFLKEEDKRVTKAREDKKNKKEMIHVYEITSYFLEDILLKFLDKNIDIRKIALRIISTILEQGLTSHSGIIPYLICLNTENDKSISCESILKLEYIETKYPGSISTQVLKGIFVSFKFQSILQNTSKQIRGYRQGEEVPYALLDSVYSLIKKNQERQKLILTLLEQFEVSKHNTIDFLLYISDNLAYFSYKVYEETLFIIQKIDKIISVSGTNILLNFCNSLLPNPITANNNESMVEEDGEEEMKESLLIQRIPENTDVLIKCILSFQPYKLLIALKKYLINIYGINESLIKERSKASNYCLKPLTRNYGLFEPDIILNMDSEQKFNKNEIIKEYLQFKMLILDEDQLFSEKNMKYNKL